MRMWPSHKATPELLGVSLCPLFLHSSAQGGVFVLLDTAGAHRASLEAVGLARLLLYPFFLHSEYKES